MSEDHLVVRFNHYAIVPMPLYTQLNLLLVSGNTLRKYHFWKVMLKGLIAPILQFTHFYIVQSCIISNPKNCKKNI